MIKYNIPLFASDKPLYVLKEAMQNMESLKDNFDDNSKTIVSKLLVEGEEMVKSSYANGPFSGKDKSQVFSRTLESGLKGYIAFAGSQVLYEEFGTGDEGAKDSHPMKPLFKLNPYNSGPTIQVDEKNGHHYWIYKPMAGEPYFDEDGRTEGIPSGKHMYNASKYLDKRASKLAEKIIKETLKSKILK